MKNKICRKCFRRSQVEDNIIMTICPGCNEEMFDESLTTKSKTEEI